MVAKMMDIRNREFYKKMITELDIKSGDNIFEIGYGSGLGIELIAEHSADCSIYGIDFSELMFQEASKRNKKYIETAKVQLSYGDLLTANLENRKYDKIFCINVIYFWNELNQVFEKIYAMLNNEGRFCIFMTPEKEIKNLKFAEDFNKYSIEEVCSALKNAGFKSVTYKLDKGYYILSIK